ncbi:MAG TPA: hypothetical protein VIP77_19385, partial [Jiangellaceae bacterium]
MDPLTIALLIGAAYAAAPVDGTTLALTRGARRAWRAGRKARKGNRVRAAVKGWKAGTKAARAARSQGRDPWSRIKRGARGVRSAGAATGQAGGQFGNGVVAGARGAGRGARWVRDHGRATSAWSSRMASRLAEKIRNRQERRNNSTEEANPEPTNPEPTSPPEPATEEPESSGHVEGLDLNPEYPDTADGRFFQLRDSGYTGPIDQDGYRVDDLDAWIEEHRPTSTTTTTGRGTTTVQITEFNNVDDLERFLREARGEL